MPPTDQLPLLVSGLFKKKSEEVEVEAQQRFADIIVPPEELSGVECPNCNGSSLIVCRDGSALCKDCRKVYQELVPPSSG